MEKMNKGAYQVKRMAYGLGAPNWRRRLYAVFVLCAATAIDLPAQTFTTLLSFDGTEGASPWAGLAQGTSGDLYGVAELGGANGGGAVFGITPSGALTTLYSFCATNNTGCTEGYGPVAGLIQGTNGDFYGTTQGGGSSFATYRFGRHGLQNHSGWRADDAL
jgi:uncharacterized repeat protein (TIGR03803 family)